MWGELLCSEAAFGTDPRHAASLLHPVGTMEYRISKFEVEVGIKKVEVQGL